MDKKMLITNSQGQQIEADVIIAFKFNDTNESYIVYTFNEKSGDNIKIYISKIIQENGDFYLDSIKDDNEWKRVKEAIIKQVLVKEE